MPLEPVPLAEIDSWSTQLEELVDRTPYIDPWCSGPDWTLPAHSAFGGEAETFAVGSRATGLALLARYRDAETQTSVISGLEPMWGFASPVLGPDPASVTAILVRALLDEPDWDTLLLPGLPLDNELLQAIANELLPLGEVRVGVAIERQGADLSRGIDPWLSRRSPRFRQGLRRQEREANTAGVTIVDASSDPDLFERLEAIESTSWKGADGSGILTPDMATMYSAMTDRLRRHGRLRASVATLDGADIGFILGGIRHRRYRGLQLSYDNNYRHLGIGHLLQWHEIRRLGDSIDHYDLGMKIDYKDRWADETVPSPALIVRARETNHDSIG